MNWYKTANIMDKTAAELWMRLMTNLHEQATEPAHTGFFAPESSSAVKEFERIVRQLLMANPEVLKQIYQHEAQPEDTKAPLGYVHSLRDKIKSQVEYLLMQKTDSVSSPLIGVIHSKEKLQERLQNVLVGAPDEHSISEKLASRIQTHDDFINTYYKTLKNNFSTHPLLKTLVGETPQDFIDAYGKSKISDGLIKSFPEQVTEIKTYIDIIDATVRSMTLKPITHEDDQVAKPAKPYPQT